MKNFNFGIGNGKFFTLSGYDDGGGITDHQIQISPPNFKKLMKSILKPEEIDIILENCELENAHSIAGRINYMYSFVEMHPKIKPSFEYNEAVEYLDYLYNFSHLSEFEESILNGERLVGSYFNYRKTDNEKESKESLGFIYLLKSNNLYKIGKTIDIEKRMKPFGVYFPAEWSLEHYFKSNNYHKAEIYLHDKFKNKREIGEWHNLDEDDLRYVLSIQDFDI